MLIRYARQSEQAQIRRLWELAFGNEEPYTGWYFRFVFRPERSLCAWSEQRELLACLQLSSRLISLAGKLTPAAFIVGVTTAAQHRHQGVGHALLRQAINDLRAGGCRMALLNTDIPAYYQPLGFTACYHLRQLTFPAQAAPLPEGWYQGGTDSLSACDQIYRAMCGQRFDGWVRRTPTDWRLFVEDECTDSSAALWRGPGAYLLCHQERERLVLRELGFDSEAALRTSLEFAASLAGEKGCTQVSWAAPLTVPLLRQSGEQTCPHVMARDLSLPPTAPADAAAAATHDLLGRENRRLWISEIT